MGAQELPQLRMTIQIILVIQQAWVFLKVFGYLRMRIEKGVEIPQFAVGDILAGILETLLALHEALRILADLLAHALVILQISREVGMFIDEILVVDQRRVPSEFAPHVGVRVQKRVEAVQFAMGNVILGSGRLLALRFIAPSVLGAML